MIKKNGFNNVKRHSFDVFQKSHEIFIEGHRGLNNEYYQNTIDSFKQAIKYNLDSIELDIWLTKDKIPIIIHGGLKGNLHHFVKNIGLFYTPKDFTLEEISKLELKETNQKIPTLKEVLNLCKNQIFINIELKDPNVIETFNQVIKLIEEKKMLNQIAMSSFNYKYYGLILNYNLTHEEKIEFGRIYGISLIPFFKRIKFDIKNISLNIYQKEITKEIVDKAHKNGNAVMAWFRMKDKENEEIYKRLFDCGIDVICCNKPNKAKEYRDNIYYKMNQDEVINTKTNLPSFKKLFYLILLFAIVLSYFMIGSGFNIFKNNVKFNRT